MLRPRLIPCLLVQDGGLVKTVNFTNPKYVGDPINAVRIFNEKEVDELLVLDISASRGTRGPDYQLIRSLAAECRMPLAYGGGVSSLEQFQRIVGLGVEKVSVCSAAITNPNLVAEAARQVGSQSVVVTLDLRRRPDGAYKLFGNGGRDEAPLSLVAAVRQFQDLGAGEIVVNSIDRDGAMKGYDWDLVRIVRDSASVPITVLGGAGSLAHCGGLVEQFGSLGVAAGSLFVFKGSLRAVLINYPKPADKDALFRQALAYQ
jgi:cyclase